MKIVIITGFPLFKKLEGKLSMLDRSKIQKTEIELPKMKTIKSEMKNALDRINRSLNITE